MCDSTDMSLEDIFTYQVMDHQEYTLFNTLYTELVLVPIYRGSNRGMARLAFENIGWSNKYSSNTVFEPSVVWTFQ